MNLSNCEFIDCNGIVPDLYTTANLTPAISQLNAGVSVVRLAEYPNSCFRVIKPILPVAPGVAYTITNVFETLPQADNCTECSQSIQLYILEDCLEVQNPIYSFSEILADNVGKVINIVGYPGVCWLVSSVVYDGQETDIVTIATNDKGVPQIFTDCTCCLPTPDPTPVKYTRVIPKPDRKFYQIKESQCDIQSNIKFAEGYYRLFKTLKYGIANACDNINLEKLWIKKNLSDLAMINDPSACVITTPVTPVVCPEPSGHPIPPIPTYTFTVGEPGVGTGTLNCSQCLDGTNPGLFGLCPVFNMVLTYNILDTIDPLAVYVFSYNGGCVTTLGSFITLGGTEGFETYTMTSGNIVNAGIEPENPCASCA